MYPHIEKFIKDVLKENPVDLSMYKDPKFCTEMRMYALEKITFLILNLLRSRPPSKLASEISDVDHHGLNLLDYCLLAGLEDFGSIFSKLGCTNTIDTKKFSKTINQGLNKDNPPPMLAAINKSLQRINAELKKRKSLIWKKINYVIKKLPYKKHKFLILILSFGKIEVLKISIDDIEDLEENTRNNNLMGLKPNRLLFFNFASKAKNPETQVKKNYQRLSLVN